MGLWRECSGCRQLKYGRAFSRGEDICRECKGDLAPSTVASMESRRAHGSPRNDGSPVPGLRSTRESLGLSVGRLAELSGVPAPTIVLLECFKTSAGRVVQERILEAVVKVRREQRDAEMARYDRLQKAGVGPVPHVDELRVRIDEGRPGA